MGFFNEKYYFRVLTSRGIKKIIVNAFNWYLTDHGSFWKKCLECNEITLYKPIKLSFEFLIQQISHIYV